MMFSVGVMLAVLAGLEAWAGPVPVTTGDAAFAPRRVAVLVGVQDYADPALQDLRYARKDAADMGRVLGSPDLGGFDRVFVIDTTEGTTRAALERTLALATADLQRDDTFLLYLSGHGTLTLDPLEGSRLWFLPSDGRLDSPERTGMSVSELEEWVSGLPARRRVLIMDTCHNGRSGSKSSVTADTDALLRGFRGEAPPPRSVLDVSESEARLYAAEYHQPAMEDNTLQNGVYTHFLIQGLTDGKAGADLNGDRLVDIAEAHQYARDHTISWTGGMQVPRAEYRIVGREEIFLAGKEADRDAAEQALISACDLLLDRAQLWLDGVPRGTLPGLYALPPGMHLVEVQTPDGRRILRERVHMVAGAVLPVESLMERRAAVAVVRGGVSVVESGGVLPMASGGIGLGVVRPWAGSARLRPEFHIDLSYGNGAVADLAQPVNGGMLSAGGGLGWAPGGGDVWAGPVLDLRVPWRQNPLSGERQAGLGGTGGLALGYDASLAGGVRLMIQVEGWAGQVAYGEEGRLLAGGALRLGLGRAVD